MRLRAVLGFGAGLFLPLAACGAPAGEAPTVPSPPVVPVTPVAPPAPQLAASAAPTQAPPGKASTRARHPAVLSVTNQSLLFNDEMDRVEAAAEKRLANASDAPVDVVPRDRLRALGLVAKKGKLREDGPVCARPPTPQEAVTAAFPGLLRVELTASCPPGDGCSASLRVSNGTYRAHTFSDGDTLAEAFVSPQDPLDVASWEAAFSTTQVKAPTPEGGGMIGLGSILTGGPQIVVLRIDARGAWSAAPGVPDFEADAKALTRSCGKSDWLIQDVLVEVADSGQISRCEAMPSDDRDTPPPCLCSALSAHRFAAASGKRRARLTLGRAGGSGTVPWSKTSGGAPQKVEIFEAGGTFDEPMKVGEARGDAMRSCFSPDGPDATFELRSSLDETGKVTGVKLAKRELTDEEARCVGKAAARFLYRCPDHAGDEVWGKFTVHRSSKPTPPRKP